MAVDDEILKTLQKIERAISNQSSTSNNQRNNSGGATGTAGGRVNPTINANRTAARSLALFTSKTLEASSALGGFKNKVQSTTALINRLNNSLRRYNNSRTNPPAGDSDTQRRTDENTNTFIGAVDKISNRLVGRSGLFKQLTTFTAHVRLLNQHLGSNRPPGNNPPPNGPIPPPVPPDGPPPGGGPAGGDGGGAAGLTRLLKSGAITSMIVSGLKGAKDVVGTVVLEDMFQRLAARGYGTTDALGTLYAASIVAGMSLAEYNKMMDESMVSVTRFKSFKAFSDELDKSKDELAKFGIFGIEAAEMSAAMISNSSALGINIKDTDSAVKDQLKVFAKLRESTNITAEEFRDLAKRMQDDDDVQRELIGLSYTQKSARIVELQQVATLGRAMNLTAAGSEKLRTALEQQRKSTVVDRFKQAGIIRQTGALVRMDANESNELAKLALIKYKSGDEQVRYNELNAKQLAGLSALQNSGNLTQQFLADKFLAKRSETGLDAIDVATIAAANATAAGPIVNDGLNKTLSETAQKFGRLITIFEGLAKNPIGTATVNLIGSAFSALLSGGIFALVVGGRIGAAVSAALAPVVALANALLIRAGGGIGPGGGPPIPPGGGGPRPPPGPPGGGRNWAKIGGRLLGGGLGVLALGMTASDSVSTYKNADEIAANRTGEEENDVGRVKGEAIGDTIGTAAGMAIGAGLSVFTGGLAAAILMPFTSMLGGWLGKMAGGWLGSKTATEKNTDEIKKNTSAIIVSTGKSEISSNNLESITANIIATSQAMHQNGASVAPVTLAPVTTTVVTVPKIIAEVKTPPVTPVTPVISAPIVAKEEPKKAEVKTPPITPVISAPIVAKEEPKKAEIIASPVNVVQKTITPVEVKTPPVTNINKPVTENTEQLTRELLNPESVPPVVLTQILSVLQETLQITKDMMAQREILLRTLSATKLSSNSQAIKSALAF